MATDTGRIKLQHSLIDNAFRFLKRAINEVEEEQQLAITHFAIGMELILKSVLFNEHWALVAVKPHRVTLNDLEAGTARTLGADQLIKTIFNITKVKVPSALPDLLAHRNRVVHFTATGDVNSVASEMWKVWHEMRLLMNQRWKATFTEHMWRIAEVEELFAGFTQYLQVRYEALDREIRNDPTLKECSTCGFKSVRHGGESSRLVSSKCYVCYESGNLTLCNNCGRWVRRNYDDPLCPKCTEMISLDGIAEELRGPTPNLKPKELANLPSPPSCPMCENDVSPWRGHWICVPCFEEFKVATPCTCGHLWAGQRNPDDFQCKYCAPFAGLGSSGFGGG